MGYAMGPEEALEACLGDLAAAARQESWKRWFATREHFRHSAGVEAALAAAFGEEVRDAATAAAWESLGWRLREGAGGVAAEGEVWYRQECVERGPNAQRIWIDYAPEVAGDAPEEALGVLERAVRAAGWQLLWEAARPGRPAVIDWARREIYVEPGAGRASSLNRLGHEVGHMLGAAGGGWAGEARAQAFAWAWGRAWGCDLGEYSRPYILGYTEGRPVEMGPAREALGKLEVLAAG